MEENQIVVVDNLIESIARKLDTLGSPNEAENLIIFPVPYRFRQSKEHLFEPSAISIGPFHHGKTRVQSMEEQKWQFLQDFLFRGDHITLDLCLSEIKKLEERTRRCYSESVPLDSDSFVEMMLLDGCFVFEYFLKWYEHRLNSIGYSVFIPSDLLLLENQIPFFIVEKLCDIGLKPDARWDFRNYLANIFARAGPAVLDDSRFPKPPAEIHHFVHLCYHCSIPIILEKPFVSSSESFSPSMLSRIKNVLVDFPLWVLTSIFPKINCLSLSVPNSNRQALMVIPCATELQNAGIKVRPKRDLRHIIDISFKNGVLEIPTLTITNESKTLLANLIAFEQYKSDEMSANLLSSFALFLDSLVNTPEDVRILQQCEIINNCLDSDEELTNFFNQICKGMVVENNHFLAELFEEVNKYCKSSWNKRLARWNRHKTQFIDTYFRSPWTAISLVAAVFIVLLTFVQSFYAVYTYYIPRRP
ncbi:UPF0481 protein At3g47200-like [Carex rostrata]